jgi:hypothetical protein
MFLPIGNLSLLVVVAVSLALVVFLVSSQRSLDDRP